MKDLILSKIPTECPWRDTLYWYDTIDSTNSQAKRMAQQGAPHGTVLIAGHQTGGRGRMGRVFQSPENMGVYLSVILRPDCFPDQLMHLTCAVGTTMCEAVEQAAGIQCGIKWINDLVWNKQKLGGILTELSIDPKTGHTAYAVIGIGINCLQSPGDFPPEIRQIATSLSSAAGRQITPDTLAAAMVTSLWKMDAALFAEKAQIMERYRSRCITLNQSVLVHRGDTVKAGLALDIDSDGALVVRFSDGQIKAISSGEVSVRGLYSYI